MKTTRREFIKTSSLLCAGSALALNGQPFIFSEAGKFLEDIGVCTDVAKNGILSSAGYEYIEEAVRNFLVPDENEAVFQSKMALLKQSKLPVEVCNNFIAGNLKCVGPAADHDKILQFTETAFRRSKTAGVKIIVFGSGGSRTIPDGFSRAEAREQFVGLCKKMSLQAEKYGVLISLEPMNTGECNFINSVEEGAGIVKEVNHKNFRLLADIYHMLRDNESPHNIVKYGDLLCHAHIAENKGRSAPGVSNEDFIPYFRAFKKIRYKGRMSIECKWENIADQAGPALQYMRNQLSKTV
jgi:sugar phosphate isomerase/epimerase